MYKSTFDRIGYQIEALQIDCEKQEVYYKTMITTHEVTIGQQSIQLKKLEEQIALDKLNAQDYARTIVDLEDKLVKAQETVEDNVNTILRLQAEVDSLLEQNEILYSLVPDGAMDIPDSEPFVPVATIPTDEYSVYLSNKATGRGMVEYPNNPEPYPYTHPIRETGESDKVRVKK